MLGHAVTSYVHVCKAGVARVYAMPMKRKKEQCDDMGAMDATGDDKTGAIHAAVESAQQSPDPGNSTCSTLTFERDQGAWDRMWGPLYRGMRIGEIAALCTGNLLAMEDGAQQITTTPFIHNMVCTCKVHCCTNDGQINLYDLATILPNSSYDKAVFAAITLRVTSPFCTSLLFSSGKLVVTGLKSFYESMYASLCVTRLLNKAHGDVPIFSVCSCSVQNIVAHLTINTRENEHLDIQRMYEFAPCDCTYQKNLFPGLILRSPRSPVVALCFYSGRVVLTGGKNVEGVIAGWKHVTEFCSQFVNVGGR